MSTDGDERSSDEESELEDEDGAGPSIVIPDFADLEDATNNEINVKGPTNELHIGNNKTFNFPSAKTIKFYSIKTVSTEEDPKRTKTPNDTEMWKLVRGKDPKKGLSSALKRFLQKKEEENEHDNDSENSKTPTYTTAKSVDLKSSGMKVNREEQECEFLKEIADYESVIRKGCKSELEKATLMKAVSDLKLKLATMRIITRKTDDVTSEGGFGGNVFMDSCDGQHVEDTVPEEHSETKTSERPPYTTSKSVDQKFPTMKETRTSTSPCNTTPLSKDRILSSSSQNQDTDGWIYEFSLHDDIELDDWLPILPRTNHDTLDAGMSRSEDKVDRGNEFVDYIIRKLNGWMRDTGEDAIHFKPIQLPVKVRFGINDSEAQLSTTNGLIKNISVHSRNGNSRLSIVDDNLVVRASFMLAETDAAATYHLKLENLAKKEVGQLGIKLCPCSLILEVRMDRSGRFTVQDLSYARDLELYNNSDKQFYAQMNGESCRKVADLLRNTIGRTLHCHLLNCLQVIAEKHEENLECLQLRCNSGVVKRRDQISQNRF